MKKSIEKIDYGNWMPVKFLIIGFILSVSSICGVILISLIWLRVVMLILSVFFIIFLCIALLAYYWISPKGKNLQNRIYNVFLEHFFWDGVGVCLDIGCGNASLSINVAKKFPGGKVIALDYWGNTPFEYNEQQCKINAKLENVQHQITFQNANAARLPFENESMDAVISNLVFHELRDFKMKEKYKGILEALRVLKKGGFFEFQDLFDSKAIYDDFTKLKGIIKANVDELHWYNTFDELKLPKWTNNPMLFGGIGIFYGTK